MHIYLVFCATARLIYQFQALKFFFQRISEKNVIIILLLIILHTVIDVRDIVFAR